MSDSTQPPRRSDAALQPGLDPRLDHVIVNLRERLDAGAERWRRLGFTLTPKGFHTLGSSNHLAIFGDDYIELLGVEPGNARTDVLDWPEGLNGLAFKCADADAAFAALAKAGAPAEAPLAFSRPVAFQGGAGEAAFRVVRIPRPEVVSGRVFFCEHLTPDLVWRDEWRSHANGALAIEAALICADRPSALPALFAAMFGADSVRQDADAAVLRAGRVRVEICTPAALTARFGDTLPGAAGRTEWMAALVLQTASLDQAADALHAGGIAIRREADRILVPAAEANQVALEFRVAPHPAAHPAR